MPLPNPTTAWKFARVLIKGAEYALPAAVAWMEDRLSDTAEADETLAWLRWHVVATRTSPTGTTEDRAEFKFDLVNITGGAIDVTYTSGDFAAIKAKFDTYLGVIKDYTGSDHTFVQYRAYLMQFNADDGGPGNRGKGTGPFVNTGAPIYVSDISIAGTGAQAKFPRQVATSVTFRTGWPKHWGRIYLPGPNTALDTTGRFISTYRATIANATHVLLDDLTDADFLPVVPVTQANNVKTHGLLGVTEVAVDDIPDVIRRRRPRQVAARTLGVGG